MQLDLLYWRLSHITDLAIRQHEHLEFIRVLQLRALANDLYTLSLHLQVHIVAIVHFSIEHERPIEGLLDRLKHSDLGEHSAREPHDLGVQALENVEVWSLLPLLFLEIFQSSQSDLNKVDDLIDLVLCVIHLQTPGQDLD